MGQTMTGMVWVLFVAVALWPPFRRGPLGFACFLLTMTVTEMPMVFVVLITAPAVLGGSSSEPDVQDWMSYFPYLFVLVGLVRLQVRARTAGPAMEDAIAARLGPGWRRTIDPQLRASLRTSTPWLAGIFLPFQRHSRGVIRRRNLTYGSHGRTNLLDIYSSRDDGRGRPILVHLHGGGFVQGAKSREGVTLLNQLASHGWVCVSANYGLRRNGVHPQPLIDTKRVIAWVRDHAAEHGADPAHIFLVGSSAGAHLAASAALTENDLRFQPGFEDTDTTVSGVVSLHGYLGPRTADPSSSPTALVGPDAPPFLVVEGGNDTIGLPPQGAETFTADLRAVSASPVVHVVLPGAQHNFDYLASVRARVVADEVEAFLDWVRTHVPRERVRQSSGS